MIDLTECPGSTSRSQTPFLSRSSRRENETRVPSRRLELFSSTGSSDRMLLSSGKLMYWCSTSRRRIWREGQLGFAREVPSGDGLRFACRRSKWSQLGKKFENQSRLSSGMTGRPASANRTMSARLARARRKRAAGSFTSNCNIIVRRKALS
ncbi:hypothetical protein BCV70DRAFT_107451 [Testicularia cyperi]|uniref:Uncharacterized protein n=1 Tax=Testicularia cyperi TaxID=1882483 RepID=A0A317XPM8_9BASI|nr:hypothetical protein BCV70DRAFT_107451 [Testicularia cyperi]